MSAQAYDTTPPGPYERFISRLSVKTAELGKESGGGVAEFDLSDFAAMTAGMGDPIARELIGVMQEDAGSVNEAVRQLDFWGWMRFRIDSPNKLITGKQHGLMALAAVADYQAGGQGYSIADIRAFVGIKDGSFASYIPHWHSLTKRLLEAESKAAQHCARQMQDD